MTRFIAILGLFLTLSAGPACAGISIDSISSTSPSWNTFTNKDGTGLYHEILKEVFGLYGVDVHHVYAKSGRAKALVEQNQADMMTCDDEPHSGLVLGRYPMYASDFYVFFNKNRIGPWKGTESLRNREIVAQPTYYNQSNFPVPVVIKELPSAEHCLSMILLNRSDFYVDDLNFINQALEESTLKFLPGDFAIEKAGARSYHPLFNTTERGQTIKKMYDDGMIRLHREGRLRPIFEKWGHTYPDFDSF